MHEVFAQIRLMKGTKRKGNLWLKKRPLEGMGSVGVVDEGEGQHFAGKSSARSSNAFILATRMKGVNQGSETPKRGKLDLRT